MKLRISFGAALLALGLVSAARANMIANPGLEKDSSTPLNPFGFVTVSPTLNSAALTGWTVTSGTVDLVPNTYWQAAEGSYSVDLVGTPGIGAIAQTVATVPATNYTLIFDLSANPEAGPFGETGTTKILRVEALAANGTSVLAAHDFPITAGTRTRLDMQWVTNAFTFTAADAASILRLSALTPLNLPGGATAANIFTGPVVDNFNLFPSSGSVATPEPASLSLLGLGAAALLLQRRRAPV